jgi:hypothetical protein
LVAFQTLNIPGHENEYFEAETCIVAEDSTVNIAYCGLAGSLVGCTAIARVSEVRNDVTTFLIRRILVLGIILNLVRYCLRRLTGGHLQKALSLSKFMRMEEDYAVEAAVGMRFRLHMRQDKITWQRERPSNECLLHHQKSRFSSSSSTITFFFNSALDIHSLFCFI